MSEDYEPQNGGQRRRRGGRNRRGRQRNRFDRDRDRGGNRGNQSSSASSASGSAPSSSVAPAASNSFSNPIKRLLSWLMPAKKEKPKETSHKSTASRPAGTMHPALARAHEAKAAKIESKLREPQPEKERKPVIDASLDITTPKLYVGNLSYEASESDIFDLFSKVGSVKNVEIVLDRRTHDSKGFGFVEMAHLDSAKKAAEQFNKTDFMGRQIVVNGAKASPRRRDETEEASATSQGPESDEDQDRSPASLI
jgi:hypothetical protein